jgi:hypothetical protein
VQYNNVENTVLCGGASELYNWVLGHCFLDLAEKPVGIWKDFNFWFRKILNGPAQTLKKIHKK